MRIQRARLLLLIASLLTSGGVLLAQTPPPGALNPALGPGQLPPPSPYYGMPGPGSPVMGGPGMMPPGMMQQGMMPPGMMQQGAMPGMAPGGVMPASAMMPPGMMGGMPPGAMGPGGMPPGAMPPGMPPGAMGPMPPGAMPGGMPGMGAMQMGAQAGAMAMGPYGVAQASYGAPCGPDGCGPGGPPISSNQLICESCGGRGCGVCGGSGYCHGVDRGLDQLTGLLGRLLPYGAGGWCAPRWYDAYADYVHFYRDEGSRGLGITSDGPAGLGQPLIVLATDDAQLDESGGFRAGVAMHLGAAHSLEFHYLGTLNWAGQAQVESPLDELYSVFSDFGNNPPPQAGPPIVRGGFTDTDSAELATLEYSSSFDTFELNCRRRWVGANCRFHGSWMVGTRYAHLKEQLVHTIVVDYPDPNNVGPDVTGGLNYFVGTSNSMTGAQAGGDLWITLLPGLRLGSDFKAGIYGNRASQRTQIDAQSLALPLIEEANEDRVSFLGELQINSVWRLGENWSLRSGYTFMTLTGVALAPENFNGTEPFSGPRTPMLVSDGTVFMHGGTVGAEFMW